MKERIKEDWFGYIIMIIIFILVLLSGGVGPGWGP